jgi:outer membrane receptor protein involved in Fe transport
VAGVLDHGIQASPLAGTAGGRPRFEAQYQTYGVSRGQISPQVLGNKDLRPELAREREIGVDATLGQRLTLTASYINTTVTDELLQVPLPGYYGFTRSGETPER